MEIIKKIKDFERRESALELDNRELRNLISVLKQAEEKSAVLNSIIESSDDGIVSKDLNGIIISWNNSAERIFGYSAMEMIGQSILKIIPKHLHGEEPEIIAQLKRGIRVDHFETQRLHKDGRLIAVSLTISPVFDGNSNIIGISKIVRDMTLHKKAEVDGKRLMAIIETSDDAIISKDLNSIITSWNESAERIFGFSAMDMIGESILKIIPEERHYEEPQILRKILSGERVNHFETERLRKDGSLICVSLTISPIKSSTGEVIGISKIARDITDKKLIEQKKGEFLAFVSHELKTPLTSLKSYIQIARQKTSDVTFLTKALQRAEMQAGKMEAMIKDFLNISRFEEGRLEIKKSEFNLSELIEECIEDAKVSHSNNTIIYHQPTRISVLADREKISMVLTNLISNAQKYSPNGGTVHITSEIVNDAVRIKVQDEGIGISPDDQRKLFQKFTRISTEQTKSIAGFGIGLYLASNILKLHGSEISVESELGKGTTFSFDLATT
ncbi:PAS domain S-box protein [Pedobacter sp. R-06]|uniref:PAS domain S-box protein n=1 Tax=Pedobacter sp. R-06 TaxID=3404051 RepID=UPI003CF48BE4